VKSETRVSTTEYQRDLLPNCKIAQTKSLQPRSNVSFTERKFHYCFFRLEYCDNHHRNITNNSDARKILMLYWSLKTVLLTQFTCYCIRTL